jgi:hypothetical protein
MKFLQNPKHWLMAAGFFAGLAASVQAQNFGIGTTTPAARLHVVGGDARIDDLGGAGQSLLGASPNGTLQRVNVGAGLDFSGGTLTNTGDTDPTDDINIGDAAGGDLGGTYPNPNVVGLQGRPITGGAPALGDVLTWDGTNWVYQPSAGDDWGSQSAQTSGAITGNGLTGNAVRFVDGTAAGNIWKWNGTQWVQGPDDGLTTVAVNAPITGNGTTGSPISLAPGTALGQVLVWNGTAWAPAAPPIPQDLTGAGGLEFATGAAYNGTVARQLRITPGTANGHVLTWNGTTWASAPAPLGADNWGTQVAQTTGVVTGNGTAASPLNVTAGTNGQVLTTVGGAPAWAALPTNQNLTGAGLVTVSGGGYNGSAARTVGINTTGATNGQVITFDGTNPVWAALPPTTVTTASPITGNGTPANPIDLVNGTANNDVLVWNGTDWLPQQGPFWRLTGNPATNQDNNFVGTTDAQGLTFRTNNVQHARLTSGGSFGIGTMTPGHKLHVVDNSAGWAGLVQNANQAAVFMGHGGGFGAFIDPGNNTNASQYALIVGRVSTNQNWLTVTGAGKTLLSRDGMGFGTECCGNDATLGIGENTAGSGRLASISFHNGGQFQGRLELVSTPMPYSNPNGTYIPNNGRLRLLGGDGTGGTTNNLGLEIANNAVFAYGQSGSRTEAKNNAGQTAGQSGFYESANTTNYPPITFPSQPSGVGQWYHMIEARHSNPNNNFSMQLAGSFFNQDLFFRKTNDSPTTPWSQIVTTNGAEPLFIIRRISFNQDNANRNLRTQHGLNFPNAEWSAMLVGFDSRANDGTEVEGVQAILNRCGTDWCIKTDLREPSNESWTLDIMFVRRKWVDDGR